MSEHEILPLEDFRGPLPLSNADFDAMRANVMARIDREKRAWFVLPLRLASVTVAIGLIALLVVVLQPRETPAPPRQIAQPIAAAAKPPAVASIGAPATLSTPAAVPAPSKPTAKKLRPHRAVETPVAVASDAHEPMTIELQTSNPDIRIIWITR